MADFTYPISYPGERFEKITSKIVKNHVSSQVSRVLITEVWVGDEHFFRVGYESEGANVVAFEGNKTAAYRFFEAVWSQLYRGREVLVGGRGLRRENSASSRRSANRKARKKEAIESVRLAEERTEKRRLKTEQEQSEVLRKLSNHPIFGMF